MHGRWWASPQMHGWLLHGVREVRHETALWATMGMGMWAAVRAWWMQGRGHMLPMAGAGVALGSEAALQEPKCCRYSLFKQLVVSWLELALDTLPCYFSWPLLGCMRLAAAIGVPVAVIGLWVRSQQ